MSKVRSWIRRNPILGPMASRVQQRLAATRFPGSPAYWEDRYRQGGTSGPGSVGHLAEFKAEFLNGFVRENNVRSVIELGCGDGTQLSLASYPSYLGIDVSPSAVRLCAERFRLDDTKSFLCYEPQAFFDRARFVQADLALSLDVIYHLVEDPVYETYMTHLFASARRFVIVYSSDREESLATYIRHRKFTDWVGRHRPDAALIRHVPNPHGFRSDHDGESFSDFFVYGIAGDA